MVLYVFRCGSEKQLGMLCSGFPKLHKYKNTQAYAFYVLTKFNLTYSKWCVVRNIFKDSPYLYQFILMPTRHQHNIKKPTFLKHEPQNNKDPNVFYNRSILFCNKHGSLGKEIKLLPSLIQVIKETQNQQAEFITIGLPTHNKTPNHKPFYFYSKTCLFHATKFRYTSSSRSMCYVTEQYKCSSSHKLSSCNRVIWQSHFDKCLNFFTICTTLAIMLQPCYKTIHSNSEKNFVWDNFFGQFTVRNYTKSPDSQHTGPTVTQNF